MNLVAHLPFSSSWRLAVLMLALGCGDDAVLPLLDSGPTSDVMLPDLDAGLRTDSGPPDASSAEDAGPDASLSTACTGEPCRVEWDQGPDLPRAVDHHTISVLGPPTARYLTVIGGVETTRASITGMSADLTIARIQDDGSLGDFVALDPLRSPISFHAQTAAEDGRVITLGGVSEQDGMIIAIPSVVFWELDTSVEPPDLEITSGTNLPSAFRHATAEIIGERLYIIAGLGALGPQDTVLVSTLADGTNGAWTEAPPLPGVRTHHASVVYEDRIYIFGGFDENEVPREDTLRSMHDAAGELTGWEVIGTWEEARWTSSGFVHDGHLYLVGGGAGQGAAARALSSVVRAEFLEMGLGSFEEVQTPLPVARAHVHQVPFVDGVLYSVGGRAGPEFSSTAEVQIGRLVSE